METKFTKGEWKSRGYEPQSNGYINIDFEDGVICVFGGCTTGMSEEEKAMHIKKAEANAKLIASAPDLLIACINALSTFYSIGCSDEAEIVKVLKETIKKATE